MTAPTTPTDEELVRRISAGEEEAFVVLYRRRQGALYRFAWQMSGSAAIAEEVTQEVFLALMREARRYDPRRGTVAAYLYGVARNHVLRRLDREAVFVPLAEESVEAPDDPHRDAGRQETVEAVRRAVLSLPAGYREAVVLCDLHEMSYEEAAAALGCAVGTVRSRLHRGRALLGAKLRPVAAGSLV